MSPPPSRRRFVETLRAISQTHGFEFCALSRDWILQISDPKTAARCSIFGYTFDINPAGSVEICKEKAATSMVLDHHGIPNIPHNVVLSPSHEGTFEYIPKVGVWVEIQRIVGEFGFPVVLKPLKGTGGMDVFKATCWKEVEAGVQHIFNTEYGLAISPFKKIINEYRCFCLDGQVELKYRKIRSSVVGDGKKPVAVLISDLIQTEAISEKSLSSLFKAAAQLAPEELSHVPVLGQEVPVQWKHNLGQGASLSFDIEQSMAQKLNDLAPKVASAIGVRFCSVDIVDVEGEGLKVMEVNSGVMMDNLMDQLGDGGGDLAHRLYESAVLKALRSKL